MLGAGWSDIATREIAARHETWYVSFPPGPAVVMLPAVAVFGLQTPDVRSPCCSPRSSRWCCYACSTASAARSTGREHLWIAAAWTLGSPALELGAHGRVWFTAQIIGALALVLYLDAGWRARRPLRAGIWLALAVACRPIDHLPGVMVFLWFWWQAGRDRAALVRFAVPLVIAGAAIAWLNWVRFERSLRVRPSLPRHPLAGAHAADRAVRACLPAAQPRVPAHARTAVVEHDAARARARSTAWRCG